MVYFYEPLDESLCKTGKFQISAIRWGTYGRHDIPLQRVGVR